MGLSADSAAGLLPLPAVSSLAPHNNCSPRTVAHGHRGERVAGVAAALGSELEIIVAAPLKLTLQAGRAWVGGKGGGGSLQRGRFAKGVSSVGFWHVHSSHYRAWQQHPDCCS